MRNYIHVNLCACLIVAQVIFVIGVDKTQNQVYSYSITNYTLDLQCVRMLAG